MQVNYWIFVVLVLVGMTIALVLPRYRLKKAVRAPFPDEWVTIVERNIAVYRSLPMPLRLQLRSLIKQFLHQKYFTGAGGDPKPTDRFAVFFPTNNRPVIMYCLCMLSRSRVDIFS